MTINNDDKILLGLAARVKKLGYEVEFLQQSEELPLSMLSIQLEKD